MERLSLSVHRAFLITLISGWLLDCTIQATVNYVQAEQCVTSSNGAGNCKVKEFCPDEEIVDLRTTPCSDHTLHCCPITECDNNRGYCVESNMCSVQTRRLRTNRCPVFKEICCPKSAFQVPQEHQPIPFHHTTTLKTTTPSYSVSVSDPFYDDDSSNTENKSSEKAFILPASNIHVLNEKFSPGNFVYQQCGQLNLNGVVKTTLNEESRAEYGEFPWMVALFQLPQKRYCCNGALIDERMILTTAHCVDRCGGQAANILARLGEWNMSSSLEMPIPRQEISVKKAYKHHEYFPSSLINNIAILKLKQQVIYSATIQPVCLPSPEYSLRSAENMIATGWGSITVSSLSSAQILKRMDLQHEEYSICKSNLQKKFDKRRFDLHGKLACVSSNDPDKERPCRGDAGAPVVVEIPGTDNRYYLHGLVSWGYDCKQKQTLYTMLTKVIDFRKWIDDVVFKQ